MEETGGYLKITSNDINFVISGSVVSTKLFLLYEKLVKFEKIVYRHLRTVPNLPP